jgi:predicted RNase H-like HicB family nuclease
VKFFVAIDKQENTDYGVSVPDFPGCHSWGETIEHALANTLEAIEGWIEATTERCGTITFKPSTLQALRENTDYEGAIWALVDIDPAKFKHEPSNRLNAL